MMRAKMAILPMTPPTIAPVLFLDEVGGCEACDNVVDMEISDVDVEDPEATDDVPDEFLLVVSPFKRKTPFFPSQQLCASVPFPQQ